MRLLLFFFCFLSSCVLTPTSEPPTLLLGKLVLDADTIWQGDIVVDGEITVAHGVTLTLESGTNVRFVRRDLDRDGLGDATIIVKGSLVASGTEQHPVRFLSAESDPLPGDWLEIRSDFAQQLLFDWCEFRDSAYTLHAHFTRGHMRNSHIHQNIDGCRLGRSRFLFQNNLVENNSGKGINFRDSEVSLLDNIIRNNRTGIFLFEKPGTSVISRNNIYQNDINLQLGDFFTDDVSLAGNWWGSADFSVIARSIIDREDDSELGSVKVDPAEAWLLSAGIQRTAQFIPLWTFETDGFVDAAPVVRDDHIFFGSWDGYLRAVDLDGKLLWKVDTGDVIDADLLVTDEDIYLHNWGRQLYQVKQTDGRISLLYEYPSSPSDDHRQAGLILSEQSILLPAWNGTLYAIDRKEKAVKWSHSAGMPLRAAPLVDRGIIYQGSGNNQLSALTRDGQLLWRKALAGPLLSSPVLQVDNVVVLDKTGILSAFSNEGALLWQQNLDQTCFYSAPLVVRDHIYVATAQAVLWKINGATGEPIWSRQLDGSIYASPVASPLGLLVADNNGHLNLLDFDSGRTLASHKVGGAIQSRGLVTGNRLYFGSRDQNLHAVQFVQKEAPSE